MIDRRFFLTYAGLVPLIGAVPRLASADDEITAEKPDYTLRIGTGLVELAPDHIVSTTLYNGQFPGPLLRFKEGQHVIVDVHNDTDTPELVHWHGQMIPMMSTAPPRKEPRSCRRTGCSGSRSCQDLRAFAFTIRMSWPGPT